MSSLYYYFPSKEDILYRIIRRHIDALLEVTGTALGDLDTGSSAALRLRTLVRVSVEQLLADRRAAGVSASQARELNPDQVAERGQSLRIYEGLFLDLIREGIATGEFVETDAAIASFVILGTLSRLPSWFRPRGRLSAAEVAELYSAMLVRGLMADPRLLAG
jgi:AcrR family transcriptional regulator